MVALLHGQSALLMRAHRDAAAGMKRSLGGGRAGHTVLPESPRLGNLCGT